MSGRCEVAQCTGGSTGHWAHVEVWTPQGWILSCADGTVRHFAEVIEPLIAPGSHRAHSVAPRAWIRQLA